MVRINRHGRLPIPSKPRHALGLKPGDWLAANLEGDRGKMPGSSMPKARMRIGAELQAPGEKTISFTEEGARRPKGLPPWRPACLAFAARLGPPVVTAGHRSRDLANKRKPAPQSLRRARVD